MHQIAGGESSFSHSLPLSLLLFPILISSHAFYPHTHHSSISLLLFAYSADEIISRAAVIVCKTTHRRGALTCGPARGGMDGWSKQSQGWWIARGTGRDKPGSSQSFIVLKLRPFLSLSPSVICRWVVLFNAQLLRELVFFSPSWTPYCTVRRSVQLEDECSAPPLPFWPPRAF